MLGSTSLRLAHAQPPVTLDQSIADTFYGCSTGSSCESAAEISSNPNRYVLVFMNMRQSGSGAGPGTWGTFSNICLAASGSTCESGSYVTLTKEGVEPNGVADTQLMIADAYTKTGFTSYMLRFEYRTVGYDLDEFGFDASTWVNTATTSPFFEDLNSCNANAGTTPTNAVCTVVSGTTGRAVVAAFSLDSYSNPPTPEVTFYQTEVSYTANDMSPLDVHGVEYAQTSSSTAMEFGFSEIYLPNNGPYLSWAMIALAIVPVRSAVTMTVSYSVVDGGSPTAPVFHYVLAGVSHSLTLTEVTKSVSVDAGTTWYVTPNPLGGSNSSEQWYSMQPLNGTASTTNIQFLFQHQYYLTMNLNPTGGGTVTPNSGWYGADQGVMITAKANSDYKFKSWTGTGSGSFTGTSTSHVIAMRSAITETANFT